jgi:D-threo-aldose 1-dehydrogenase
MTEFARRQVGRTKLQVRELGLGCATLGGSRIGVARQAAEDIVAAAWAAGVRYVETAPFYGVGQAERAVGDAMRDHPRDDWVLSTKVGRLLRPNPTGEHADGRHHPLPFDPVYDYSYDGIMRSFEDSFQRLGLARIDNPLRPRHRGVSARAGGPPAAHEGAARQRLSRARKPARFGRNCRVRHRRQ